MPVAGELDAIYHASGQWNTWEWRMEHPRAWVCCMFCSVLCLLGSDLLEGDMLMCSATPFYPEEFGSYSFRQQRESSLICPKKCCSVKSRVIWSWCLKENRPWVTSGPCQREFHDQTDICQLVVPSQRPDSERCFAERFSIITLSLWIWLSADALHSDNFPWGPSYAMSICFGMGIKRTLHLSEACCIHQRPWRDQFSSCQLLTHLSKEALWMNSRLPDLVNQEAKVSPS